MPVIRVAGEPLTIETWEGSAELTRYGAVFCDEYPGRWAKESDATGERVEFEMSEPTLVLGPLDSQMYKQEFRIRVTTDNPTRARELAMETILNQADAISFASDRRVHVSFSLLSKVASRSDDSEERTLLFGRRWKGPQKLVYVHVDLLAYIEEQIVGSDIDRARKATC